MSWNSSRLPGVGMESRPVAGRSVSRFLTSATSQPSALLIEGEAGIGKTTLWLAACGEGAGRWFPRIVGARAAESVLAYTALADLLDGVPASAWMDLPDPQRAAVDQVLLRADNDSADQRAVAAAFLSVVEYLTDDGPLLVAIDDLQWIDPSSMHVVASRRGGSLDRSASAPRQCAHQRRRRHRRRLAAMPRPDWVNRIGCIRWAYTIYTQRCRRGCAALSRPTMGRIPR